MKGILYAQFKLLLRRPSTFLLMTGVSILFALFFGLSSFGQANLPVYSDMSKENTELVMNHLEEADTQSFEMVEKEELYKSIREGNAEAGLHLYEDHYEVVIASETPAKVILEQNIQKAFAYYLQDKKIASADGNQTKVMEQLEAPMFSIETSTLADEDSFAYDAELQAIFGMTVFFVIYTVAYNVIQILVAKQQKIWDRFILSPVKKWEMYAGILSYAFILGYIQVVMVFSIMKFGFDVNFYGSFPETLILLIPYVLAIVSLSLLIAAISKNYQTFNAITSLTAVSMAMVGGSYWPIEIVSNKGMLALSHIDPVTYIMDALKSVTIYGQTLSETMFPVSILLLMTVIIMGIGLNLMERK
ncbi:linearmycin resistance permease LnrN [Salinibacillus aidingensis]|uniref:Linearmycin resistance permease LnrN n=1 Tax=Salinibacillus aidingensis TaxID=237684 RepID=A0ABP3LDC1_9BACI